MSIIASQKIVKLTIGISRWILWDLDCVSDFFEQRMRLSTIDVHFSEKISSELKAIARSDMFQTVQYIIVVLISLMTKLVAKYTKTGHSRSLSYKSKIKK